MSKGKVNGSENTHDIHVYYGGNNKHLYRSIYGKSEWFNNAEYFIFEDDGECLVIKKCYMETPKHAYKSSHSKVFQIKSNLPLGRFNFDEEESNEDELFIYYKEQINNGK